MQRRPGNAGGQGGPRAKGTAIALNWRYMAPVAALVAVLAFAFGMQPGPSQGDTGASSMATQEPESELVELPTATPTLPLPTSTPEPQPTASDDTGGDGASARGEDSAASGETPEGEVASARSTPSDAEASGTPGNGRGEDGQAGSGAQLVTDSAQCGPMQESNHPVGVEQKLGDIAVRATNVAVYPTDYLRCILLATGGEAATALASAVGDAGRDGATHAVLIDLWISNSGMEFGQVNLRSATIIAGGTEYSPLGVLNGRAESVVSSGQSRTVTLLAAVSTTYGPTTGPLTLSIGAPLVGGQETQGKYQLFLPTP